MGAELKRRPACCNLELLDLAGVALPSAELRTLDDPFATTVADDFEMLASQLQNDPSMLAKPELVMRHLDGEIGDRTDRFIPTIDSLKLTELRRNRLSVGHCHGQPTMSDIKRRKKLKRTEYFF